MLKCENFSIFRQFNEFGCSGKLSCLNNIIFANLAILGTGNSNIYGNLIFNQIGEIGIGFIPGGGFYMINHSWFGQKHSIIG